FSRDWSSDVCSSDLERAEQVDFANPYMKVAIGVAASKDSDIKSVEDLKGKKLIVNKGTTAETYFTANHPEIELVKYDQNTEAFEIGRASCGKESSAR